MAQNGVSTTSLLSASETPARVTAAGVWVRRLSIFEVESNEQLHQILRGLPLFPFMTISVTPLAGHPSDIALVGPVS